MAWHRSARLWTALAAGLIALAVATVALVEVTTTGPRVTVQWRADIAPADRLALERRYDLQGGTFAFWFAPEGLWLGVLVFAAAMAGSIAAWRLRI